MITSGPSMSLTSHRQGVAMPFFVRGQWLSLATVLVFGRVTVFLVFDELTDVPDGTFSLGSRATHARLEGDWCIEFADARAHHDGIGFLQFFPHVFRLVNVHMSTWVERDISVTTRALRGFLTGDRNICFQIGQIHHTIRLPVVRLACQLLHAIR